MKVNVEQLSKSEKKITVSLTVEELKPYEAKVLAALQSQVKVAGFRPGHIPAEMVMKQVGEQAFKAHVLDAALQETYAKALEQEKLVPIDYPEVKITKADPLEYEAVVPLFPELEWKKDVQKLKVKSQVQKVSEKEMKEVLENLQQRFTTWNKVERAAKMGDRIELDFEGFDAEGKAMPNTASKHHPLILGSKAMIPGFEEALVGKKAEEEGSFKVTFPEDYHSKDLQAKELEFKYKIHQIDEPETPKIDDDFAVKVTAGNRKTVDELKKEVEEELQKQKEREEQVRLENEFLKDLLAYIDLEVPGALLKREVEFMKDRLKKDWEAQGRNWDDYLAQLEAEKKNLDEEMKETAENQVKLRFALEKLYSEEKAEVSDQEVEDEIEVMLTYYPVYMRDNARENLRTEKRSNIAQQLKLRKIVQNHTEASK